MNKPFFDQYYRYDEMTQLLRDFTQAFTTYSSGTSTSIGKVDEYKRRIWALTRTRTGNRPDRPVRNAAHSTDGNIHSQRSNRVAVYYSAYDSIDGDALQHYGEKVAHVFLLGVAMPYNHQPLSVPIASSISPVLDPRRTQGVSPRGRARRPAIHRTPTKIRLYAHRGSGRRLEGFDERSTAAGFNRRPNQIQRGLFYRVSSGGLIRSFDGVDVVEPARASKLRGSRFSSQFPG